MEDRRPETRAQEGGFALILAILSLMLLTFLGLTLATTTSTELQIATNYRWSQQALYNAEAGLEAARIVLSNVAKDNPSAGWGTLLYAARTTPWTPPSLPPAPSGTPAGRDYERQGCDTTANVGYGRVIEDASTRYENVSTFADRSLNGAFTIWIRRNLIVSNAGAYTDDTRNDLGTIVAEGVAPYTGPGTAFTRSRQAVRVLEVQLALGLESLGDPCLGAQAGQEGGSPMGENFNPCAPITAGAQGSLAGAFGGTGGGSLDAKAGVK